MRVIYADDVTTVTCQSAPYGRCDAVACPVVLEPLLLVLVTSQRKLVTEVPVVPRAIDQAATLGAVPDGQGRGI